MRWKLSKSLIKPLGKILQGMTTWDHESILCFNFDYLWKKAHQFWQWAHHFVKALFHRDYIDWGTLSKSLQMQLGGGYHGIIKELLYMLYIWIPVEKGPPVAIMRWTLSKSIKKPLGKMLPGMTTWDHERILCFNFEYPRKKAYQFCKSIVS